MGSYPPKTIYCPLWLARGCAASPVPMCFPVVRGRWAQCGRVTLDKPVQNPPAVPHTTVAAEKQEHKINISDYP